MKGKSFRSTQQVDHFFVRNLGKATIELSYRIELLRRVKADKLIHLSPEPGACGGWRHWNCNDQLFDLHVLERINRRIDAGPSGNPIIYQDDCAAFNLKRRPVSAIEESALLQRLLHLLSDTFNLLR